ncbi:MAG: FecR domain-containing protein [Myxococcaceae bacterium]|nr:FecR domain-containing protein [Myxococcaceae bacterium]
MTRSFTLLFAFAGLWACSGGDADKPAARPAGAVDAGAPLTAKPAATLDAMTGSVTVTRKGATGPAVKGPLFDGDVVETGDASSAVLKFSDGRSLELGANGRIELGAEGDGLVLEIGQGTVVSRVVEGGGPGVQLTLDTPYGLVRVGAGGVSLSVRGDEASVDVLAGDVTLVSREGSSLTLEAGAGGTLSKQGATRRVTLEPLTVVLSGKGGRAEVKKKGEKTFTVVNAKKPPVPLAAGDTVRVSGGAVTLSPAQSDARVTLGAGTEVGVGESVRNSGAEELALEVKKGSLQLGLPFGKKRTVRPGDGVALVAEQGGVLSVARVKNGLELSSTVGDVVVMTETGEPVTVKGGRSAVITKAGVEQKGPEREALVLPTRQGLRLLHPGAERVALTWPGAEDAAWRVQLGTDAALSKPLIDGVVHQPFFNTLAPARGALFWRVSQGDTEVAKGSVVCGPEKQSDELGGIMNEVPAGPEKTVIYFQDKPPALTFTWKKPDKPVSEYLLKVYRAGNLAAPIAERRTPATQAELPLGSISEGQYQWDVTWLDAAGTPIGTAGKMNQLELQYDNAVRALLIKAPRNGDPPAAKVAVSGIAPMGVKVSANGQLLTLDAKARFSGQVTPLSRGRVAFRSVFEGSETYVVRWLGKGGSR